jgi:predicted dehydrogenase
MKRIRIAQIGTSQYSHGNSIWQSLLKQSDLFEVVGYALPENEKEKFPAQAKAFEGYREMTVEEILSDPTVEAVAVETEEIYLTKYALRVAKAGKHLHMEKPGGTDLASFRELIATLKEKKLAFTTGYMYRHNPKVKELLSRIEGGEFGKIYSVEAHMSCLHSDVLRQWLECFPGGMLFFLGCHLIDLIYRIMGEPLEVIPLSTSTHFRDVHTEDFGMAVFRYPNGVAFAKTCDVEKGGFLRRQLVVAGEKGTAQIMPLEVSVPGGQYTEMRECFSSEWAGEWIGSQSEVHDRYDGMMRNFAEIVRGKENPYTYDYELGLYTLVLKACGKEQ